MVKSSLGGEVYALSETAGRMLLLEDFYGPFEGMNPGAGGLEDWGSLFPRLKTQEMIAGMHLGRHSF